MFSLPEVRPQRNSSTANLIMNKLETILHTHDDYQITLYHDPEDPLSWVLRKWKKQLFWRKCTLNRWFITRDQAERYAAQLVKDDRRGINGSQKEHAHG